MKQKFLEMKYKVTEIKDSIDELNSRIQKTKERSRELEYRVIQITQSEQQRKIDWKKENLNRASETCGSIKKSNIYVIGNSKEWQKEGKAEKYSKK